MLSITMGLTAFLLYLIYDINSFTRQYRLVYSFFPIGTMMLGTATLMDMAKAWRAGCFSGVIDVILLIAAALSFAAVLYCLFFALPVEKTYSSSSTSREIYSGGVYALCRHPGILCFFIMNVLIGVAALPDRMILHGMLYSGLNLAYAWFQDRVTFPKTFCNYSEYQKKVPFLIPTKNSIRRAEETLRMANKEGES